MRSDQRTASTASTHRAADGNTIVGYCILSTPPNPLAFSWTRSAGMQSLEQPTAPPTPRRTPSPTAWPLSASVVLPRPLSASASTSSTPMTSLGVPPGGVFRAYAAKRRRLGHRRSGLRRGWRPLDLNLHGHGEHWGSSPGVKLIRLWYRSDGSSSSGPSDPSAVPARPTRAANSATPRRARPSARAERQRETAPLVGMAANSQETGRILGYFGMVDLNTYLPSVGVDLTGLDPHRSRRHQRRRLDGRRRKACTPAPPRPGRNAPAFFVVAGRLQLRRGCRTDSISTFFTCSRENVAPPLHQHRRLQRRPRPVHRRVDIEAFFRVLGGGAAE